MERRSLRKLMGAVAIGCLLCVAGVAQAGIADSLVLHTTFDGATVAGSTVQDTATPPAENGTLTGNVAQVTGLIGDALDFAGTSGNADRVDFGNVFNPGTGSQTVSVWFKPDAVTTTDFMVGKGNASSGNPGWSIWLAGDDLHIRGRNTTGVRFNQQFTNAAVAGQWNHAVMVIDGTTDQITGYFNGSNGGATSGYGTAVPGDVTTTDTLKMGVRQTTGAEYAGALDDVAVWDRTLSPAEAALVYRAGLQGRNAAQAETTATGAQFIGATTDADAYVNSGAPTTNYATGEMRISSSKSPVMHFDLSAANVPAGQVATVVPGSAQLTLYETDFGIGVTNIVGRQVVGGAWDEGTVTYNTLPALDTTQTLFTAANHAQGFNTFAGQGLDGAVGTWLNAPSQNHGLAMAGSTSEDGYRSREQLNSPMLDAAYVLSPSTDAPVTSGMLAHYDASHALTDGSGNVTAWVDRAGGDHPALQADPARRPAVVAGALNGQPVLRFDGSNDFLKTLRDPAFDTNELTWFVVANPHNPASTDVFLRFGYDDIDPGTPGNQGQDALCGAFTQSGNWYSHSRAATGSFKGVGQTATANQFAAVTGIWDGNNVTQFLNGIQGSTATDANADPSGHRGTSIGAQLDGTSGFDGDIAEVMIFDRALSTYERVSVENYIGLKYGALPVSDAPVTSDLVVHLDADYLLADGSGKVNVWNNRAQALHCAYQTDAARQPTVIPNLRNGHNGVRFDGTNDYLRIPDADELDPGTNGFSIFVVGNLTDTDSTRFWLGKGNASSGDEGYSMFYGSAGEVGVRANADGDRAGKNLDIDPMPTSLVSYILTGSEVEAYLNKSAAGWQNGFAGASDALYSGDINTTLDLLLGARSDLNLLFEGELFEVMIYNRALGGAEREAVEQYLMEKYNIPEPTTLVLLGCGIAALARRRRRRK